MVPTGPSDTVLLTSLAAYPLLRRLFAGTAPAPLRLLASNKLISTIHSTLVASLALYYLHQCHSQWFASSGLVDFPQHTVDAKERGGYRQGSFEKNYPDDTTNPVIQSRSVLANTITALECGYLIQDTFSLIAEGHLRFRMTNPSVESTVAGILKHSDKTLLAHHIGIAAALSLLQYYIHQGRERGIYIIVQFLLMNSSTPFLNLRWWLRTYHANRKVLCLASDLAFVAAFYVARVGLIGWILKDYGKYHGSDNALVTFRDGLRLPCQLGTGALWAANTSWWAMLVLKVGKTFFREGNEVRKTL